MARPITRLKQAVRGAGRRLRRLGLPVGVPTIRRRLPHDPDAFTQGLLYAGDVLYESTGLVGRSSLRSLDVRTGRLLRQVPVPGDHAEGIAALGSTLYQLSWQSGIARLYRLPDLEPAGEIRYEGEGWGLTTTPDGLLMSDGSHVLRVRDDRLRTVRAFEVRSHRLAISKLNDLAWARGAVYANVLDSSEVFQIDPADGQVAGIVDCSELVRIARPAQDDAVLNGITFDPDEGTFYLTGKRWEVLFEVEMPRFDAGRSR